MERGDTEADDVGGFGVDGDSGGGGGGGGATRCSFAASDGFDAAANEAHNFFLRPDSFGDL